MIIAVPLQDETDPDSAFASAALYERGGDYSRLQAVSCYYFLYDSYLTKYSHSILL